MKVVNSRLSLSFSALFCRPFFVQKKGRANAVKKIPSFVFKIEAP